MHYSIQNENLICKITSKGAEIQSLVDKSTGKEHIWQIDESIWGSSSPVLFPAIGKIKSGKIQYKGKKFDMPKHGIIRNNKNLEVENYSENHCAFILESSEKTLKQYPFQFVFKVEYKLVVNRLLMTYHIKNKDNTDMYFACGGHTAYACPLNDKTSLADYVIEFPRAMKLKALTLGDSGLLSSRKRNIKIHQNLLYLSETLFDDDALIFADINCDWVRLRRKEAQKGILVNFKEYPNLALWAKPGADYVCIEPWLGLPDSDNESLDLSEKLNYRKLNSSQSYSITIETIIE